MEYTGERSAGVSPKAAEACILDSRFVPYRFRRTRLVQKQPGLHIAKAARSERIFRRAAYCFNGFCHDASVFICACAKLGLLETRLLFAPDSPHAECSGNEKYAHGNHSGNGSGSGSLCPCARYIAARNHVHGIIYARAGY